jgi:glutathione S-transferase
MKLYGFKLSGHSHRVELFLNLLDLPYEFVQMELAGGKHRTPEYLAMNSFGEVPVLQDGDVVLADSTAILVYLASKYDDSGRWLPRDPVAAANVQRWLSAASGKIAYGLFDVLEQELQGRRFLVGENASIADVAAFSYIEHAPEGGVSLKPYPNIRNWLANVRALPGFVAMQATKAGVAPEAV